MTADERLFCSKPFTWFEVSRGKREGEVYLCCPAWLPKTAGNLLDQDVSEIWNGPVAIDLRRSILDQSFKYCKADLCPYLQSRSGPVQKAADVTDPRMRRVIDEALTVLPWGPRDVNCSHDRSCNLSCPSCRLHVIMETENRDRILTIQNKLNDQALQDAELLYITGSGDPFGSPYFRKWLQTMKRSDMPSMKKIHLHTNGLLWTRRVWDTIPAEIRELIRFADISIDAATPATYAINRRGGEFARLLENLSFISGELRARGPLEWLGINMVVQENNFSEMRQFVQMGRDLRVDTVYFHKIVNWGTFSNDEYRRRAIHIDTHPRHGELIDVLRDPIFNDPIVYLGNLTETRPADATPERVP
jgi:MoaA/NifB/PqqE/SkfB family radical SAM enzyme